MYGFCNFYDCGDVVFLMLVRSCLKLYIFIISERIFIVMVILIVKSKLLFEKFIVCKNGLFKRCDGLKLDNSFSNVEIKRILWFYEIISEEIFKIFGKRWVFMLDKNFKKL